MIEKGFHPRSELIKLVYAFSEKFCETNSFNDFWNVKDPRGWQFLTMKGAETLCIVCLPPEKHIS